MPKPVGIIVLTLIACAAGHCQAAVVMETVMLVAVKFRSFFATCRKYEVPGGRAARVMVLGPAQLKFGWTFT